MTLILTPLKKALAALDSGIVRALAAPQDDMLRDACIQLWLLEELERP